MSETIVQWSSFALFLILAAAAIALEIGWLVRKGWAQAGRASAYVLVSDLLSFAISGIVVFVLFFIMFMMVMGPAGRGSDAPQIAYVATTLLAVICPILLLFLSKRVFLGLFKMRSGRTAWVYSLVSAISIPAVTLIPPSVIFYLLGYASAWK